jgi:hypothetical protein
MRIILLTALVAGSLDLGMALLFFTLRTRQKPAVLLRYIASAVFGDKAFKGNSRMVVAGIGFHYAIALCWVGFYCSVYPTWHTTMFVDATIYGLLVWVVMNLVVLPLSKARPRPFSISFMLINILILIIAIGLPCAYAARHFLE